MAVLVHEDDIVKIKLDRVPSPTLPFHSVQAAAGLLSRCGRGHLHVMTSAMEIEIASRRCLPKTLVLRFPEATIVDVTSKASTPWVRFSPFFPHGGIPVPFCPGVTSQSVEGIWQGLKVFASSGPDASKFAVTSMKGIKRTVRRHGRVLGHAMGLESHEQLSYRAARHQIYLPSYLWVLENRLTKDLAQLRSLANDAPLVLLDYETNCDVENLAKPLSHAGLIRAHLLGDWPRENGGR